MSAKIPREIAWAWVIAGGALLWVIIIITVVWLT